MSSQPPPGGEKGPKGKFKGPQEVKDRPAALKVDLSEPPPGLVKNPRFYTKSADVKVPQHYALEGDAAWVWCGEADEDSDSGIALYSGRDLSQDGQKSGAVSHRVTGFAGGAGKWFRFTFRGLAEPGFEVKKNALFMRVEYFGKKGTNPLDGVTQNIDPLVERDRRELAANGKFLKNGGAVWKTYALEFRLPFAEIDTLDIGVGFKNGSGNAETGSEFFVTEFTLVPIPAPGECDETARVRPVRVRSIANCVTGRVPTAVRPASVCFFAYTNRFELITPRGITQGFPTQTLSSPQVALPIRAYPAMASPSRALRMRFEPACDVDGGIVGHQSVRVHGPVHVAR